MAMHEKCTFAWLVFTQTRVSKLSAYGVPKTSGDAYVDESVARRNAKACTGPNQVAWVIPVRVHDHSEDDRPLMGM